MKGMLLLFLSCLVCMTPFTARAQDRGEVSVFGGYSNSWALETKHGWNASIAANMTKHLALVADFSGFYRSWTSFQSQYKLRDFSLMFGPRYVHTFGKRWTPFAHVLLGQYRETRSGSPAVYDGSTSRNWLALGLGGGIDVRVNNRISFRTPQFEIVRLGNGSSSGHFARTSIGAVIRLSRVSQ